MGMIIVYRHIFLTNIMGWRIDPGLGGSIKFKTSGLEMAAREKIWRGVGWLLKCTILTLMPVSVFFHYYSGVRKPTNL